MSNSLNLADQESFRIVYLADWVLNTLNLVLIDDLTGMFVHIEAGTRHSRLIFEIMMRN